ncbi:MAG: hypothetical protein JST38_08255 [Bacteroidetes bacterium]|nr:hypothetical protein [Bacteroidota bacterium]
MNNTMRQCPVVPAAARVAGSTRRATLWEVNGLPGMYSYKAWLTEYGPLEKEYNGSFVLIR